MKTKYFGIAILMFISVACNKDWLDPKPLSIFVPENTYIDKAGMESVLLSCRKNLRNDFYAPTPTNLAHEYICSDLAASGETGTTTTQDFNLQVTPTGTGSSDFFKDWKDEYYAIRDANVIISRIHAPEWKSEKEMNEILSEAYFHRAYWYYRLVH